MEIRAERVLGVLYQCSCGGRKARLGATQTRRNREYGLNCYSCGGPMEIVERRHYTIFAMDSYHVAGTLGKLGPFTVCDLVFPTLRAFQRWLRERRAENAEKMRVYLMKETERKQRFEESFRKKKQERVVSVEEAIVCQRGFAAEYAEKIARAVVSLSLDDSDEFP